MDDRFKQIWQELGGPYGLRHMDPNSVRIAL
jgi:hypothetical protein